MKSIFLSFKNKERNNKMIKWIKIIDGSHHVFHGVDKFYFHTDTWDDGDVTIKNANGLVCWNVERLREIV